MNWKLTLAVLVCNILFMSASYTMLIPFLPLYLTNELDVAQNSVNLWSGLVFSASFVVSAIMAPIWGRLADRHGKRLMAIRSSLLLSLSYLLCGIVQTPGQLVAARLVQGFSAGLWPMDLAIMSVYAPPARLGLCLGIMQGVLTAGGVIGPLLGGTLAEFFGMRLSFFVGAAALFLNCLMFIFIIKEPPATKPKTSENTDKKHHSLLSLPLIRHLLIAGLLVQMVILILQPIITTYIVSLAGNLPNLVFVSGLVFSLGGIAGAIAAPAWGAFGQRRGFIRSMMFALGCAGAGIIFQGIPDDLCTFAVMQFICGLFFAGIHPAINALLAHHSPADAKGQIFGLLFAAQQIGSIAGPVLGGLIATFFGMKYVFFLAGTILLALAVFIHQRFTRVRGLRKLFKTA